MNRLYFIASILAFSSAKAVVYPAIQGSSALALGGVSCFKSDPFVAFNHCGSLAFANKNSISLAFQSQYFVEGLNSAVVSWHTKINKLQTCGLGYSFFGNSYYNESLLKLSIANKFSSQFGGGISMNYLRVQLPTLDYKAKHLITCEVGLSAKFNSKIDFAFLFTNPIPIKVSSHNNERLPFFITSSIFYKNDSHWVIGLEWNQKMGESGYLKAGLKYCLNKNFEINLGMFGKPINPTFGFEYFGKKISIQVAVSLHPDLNAMSGSGISFYPSSNKF